MAKVVEIPYLLAVAFATLNVQAFWMLLILGLNVVLLWEGLHLLKTIPLALSGRDSAPKAQQFYSNPHLRQCSSFVRLEADCCGWQTPVKKPEAIDFETVSTDAGSSTPPTPMSHAADRQSPGSPRCSFRLMG